MSEHEQEQEQEQEQRSAREKHDAGEELTDADVRELERGETPSDDELEADRIEDENAGRRGWL